MDVHACKEEVGLEVLRFGRVMKRPRRTFRDMVDLSGNKTHRRGRTKREEGRAKLQRSNPMTSRPMSNERGPIAFVTVPKSTPDIALPLPTPRLLIPSHTKNRSVHGSSWYALSASLHSSVQVPSLRLVFFHFYFSMVPLCVG